MATTKRTYGQTNEGQTAKRAKADTAVATWNKSVPPFGAVRYYPTKGSETYTDTVTESVAFVDEGGHPVVFVLGVRGSVRLENLEAL